MQVEHNDKASLARLGTWLLRRTLHCEEKLREAKETLATCGFAESALQRQWEDQVKVQTKPLQRTRILHTWLGCIY